MSIRYLNKQIIRLDSHNRTAGTHDNFWIDVDLAPEKEVDTIVVKSATIKKSWYIVQDGSNTFTLQEGAQTAVITVTPGNYSASSFVVVLQALLNAASLTMSHYTYAITIPSGIAAAATAKFTYTSTGTDSAFIIGTDLFEQLGFEPNITKSFVGGVLISDNCLNFQVKSILNIHSNMVGNGKNNILQGIKTNGSNFVTLEYDVVDAELCSLDFKPNGNSYNFIILDEDHQPVDLTLNVLIELAVYKKNNIIDKMCAVILDFIDYYIKSQ